MPFLFLARLFYQRRSDRFYAPDLLLEASRRTSSRPYTFFLFGGFPGAPEKIADFLRRQHPSVRIVGTYAPPFREMTAEEDEEFCRLVNEAAPDFVWVGLGSPKQDWWIANHLDEIHGAILVPSGATFDFFSGRIRQAPAWIRNIGFEWLFRLTRDFRRLWKRYTVYNVVFLVMFFLERIHIVSFEPDGDLLFLGRRTAVGNR